MTIQRLVETEDEGLQVYEICPVCGEEWGDIFHFVEYRAIREENVVRYEMVCVKK
jgi:hypothetical protein